jgi:glycosyltransferase involved in cell wall biosynthesis
MKSILYIHHGGGIGGAPLSLLYLLQQLDRSRFKPVVVTLRPGPMVDLYRAEGIEAHVEPGISDFSHTNLEWYGRREWWRLPGKLLRLLPSIRKTREVIRRIKPDLVHLNSSTLAPSAIACAQEHMPVVWHIREPLAKGYLGIRRAILRRLIDRIASRVIAISQYDANQLTPSQRIKVVYNFVDFSTFNPEIKDNAIRAELNIAPGAPVILMLGGVAEPKGTLELVRAVPLLLKRVPDARIIIAGPALQRGVVDGGLKGIAKRVLRTDAYDSAVAKALDAGGSAVQNAVIFTGIRQDIPQLIVASNILVFPSVVPHFARPIIEAAAMGIPSVASDLGGPKELILHGETGLLVPSRDPQVLADALAELLYNPGRTHAMGEAAYLRARQLFDAGTNAATTLAVYDEILVN